MTEKFHEHNGMNLHFIQTKKFKTVTFSIKCCAPLDKNTVTNRALLAYLLEKGTINYPSEKQLMLKLDELYGAIFYIDVAKKGNQHILTFHFEVANEKYINNETTIIEESLQLLQEIIFQPNIVGGTFPEKVVKREKATLKNKIGSIVDDKMAYANRRLIDEMYRGENFSTHTYGYEKDLEAITPSSIYDAYQEMIHTNQFDIYVVGDFDTNEMEQKFSSIFQHVQESNEINRVDVERKTVTEVNEVVETEPIQQAKLHIGYRTNCTYKDDDYAALQLFNGLFGAFPNSKLFVNVREKNSLAYYAASRIESHQGLLLVFSGIEAKNYELARDIINEQMKAMQQGEFTDDEIQATKELIISQLKETLDSARGTIELFYQQVIGERKLSPQDLMDEINEVTKEDIIRVANNIQLDTVYLLTSEGGAADE